MKTRKVNWFLFAVRTAGIRSQALDHFDFFILLLSRYRRQDPLFIATRFSTMHGMEFPLTSPLSFSQSTLLRHLGIFFHNYKIGGGRLGCESSYGIDFFTSLPSYR